MLSPKPMGEAGGAGVGRRNDEEAREEEDRGREWERRAEGQHARLGMNIQEGEVHTPPQPHF